MKREEERIINRMLKGLTDEQVHQRAQIAMAECDRWEQMLKTHLSVKSVSWETIAEYLSIVYGQEVVDLYCAYFDEIARRFPLTPA